MEDSFVQGQNGPSVQQAQEQSQQCQMYAATNAAIALANRAARAEGYAWRMERELGRAQFMLQQKQLVEDAYTTITKCGGITYTVDRTGRPVELLNREIEQAYHIIPLAPSAEEPYYLIKLQHVDQQAVLTEKEYGSDKDLIRILQELPGVQVRRIRSTGNTAFLLRAALQPSTIRLPFYTGWQRVDNEDYRFLIFSRFTTHRGLREIDSVSPLTKPTDCPNAFRQFRIHLQGIGDAAVRDFLALSLHIAVLYSLLKVLGYPFRLALYIEAGEIHVHRWLEALFTWYGDTPLHLDMLPSTFGQDLYCRKDGPLLVLDRRCTTEASANAKVLSQVIATGEIYRKCRGGEEDTLSLQALPVVLANASSSLACHPCCVEVEVSSAGLQINSKPIDSVVINQYLSIFCEYTQSRMARLSELLAEKRREVSSCNTADLNNQCADGLGVMLAVKEFLDEFAHSCGHSSYGWGDNTERWLTDLFEQVSWKEADYGSLADQFVSVARSHISGGAFSMVPVMSQEDPGGCVVYYDDNSLFFTKDAFLEVCQHLGQSRPVVLEALCNAGVLTGRPVNATTLMTRVRVWNAYGVRCTVRVYCIPRRMFEQLGDPLILEEDKL